MKKYPLVLYSENRNAKLAATLGKSRTANESRLQGYLKIPAVVTMNSARARPSPTPQTCSRHPRPGQPGACDHALW